MPVEPTQIQDVDTTRLARPLATEPGWSIAGTKTTLVGERYELRDRIGSGASGQVFEAYDRRLGRLVALKTLPLSDGSAPILAEEMQRFLQEAQSVSRLSHPGIVTVHDFGQEAGFAWIVMELVIGATLRALLDSGSRPGPEETVRIGCALLDALHYAHRRGIVHRDVKPANILLVASLDPGLGDVRLADFGIAHAIDGEQTGQGQLVGTPGAMSPEQVRCETLDHRTDLWATGVVVYEMLTAKRPFRGGLPAIFQNILTEEPPPPSTLVQGLPTALDAVIAKALAKRREDRFADAAAMAQALREALGMPAAAPVPAAALPPSTGAAGAAATPDPAPSAISPLPWSPAPPPPRPRIVGSRRRQPTRLALAFGIGLACGVGGSAFWQSRGDALQPWLVLATRFFTEQPARAELARIVVDTVSPAAPTIDPAIPRLAPAAP
jgi:serine/threonine protein kinase